VLIAAACKEKGIAYLKGEAKVNVRKVSPKKEEVVPAVTNEFTVTVNGQKYQVKSDLSSGTLLVNGEIYDIDIQEGGEGSSTCNDAGVNGAAIKAGLPGSIFKVLVKEGDTVAKGQAVIIIEAMKMEIEVTSPQEGVVSAVKVKQGDTVVNGQLLVVL